MQVNQRAAAHSDLEAAYSDLDALNNRLMASLEDTAAQLSVLHGKVEGDQAEAAAEREKLDDAVAELARAREAHEVEAASIRQRLEASQAEGAALRLQLTNLQVVSDRGSEALREIAEIEQQHELERAETEVLMLGEYRDRIAYMAWPAEQRFSLSEQSTRTTDGAHWFYLLPTAGLKARVRELETLLESEPAVELLPAVAASDLYPDLSREPSLGLMYNDGDPVEAGSPPRQHDLPAMRQQPAAKASSLDATADGGLAVTGTFSGLRPLLGPDGMLISYSGSPSFSRSMSMRSMSAPSTPLPVVAESPPNAEETGPAGSRSSAKLRPASSAASPTRSRTRESADSFGAYVSGPAALRRSADAHQPAHDDVRASSGLEEELAASRKSFERSNSSLAQTNARLILQVSLGVKRTRLHTEVTL